MLCLIAALALLLFVLNHLYGFYAGDAYSIAAVVLLPGLFALVSHTPREIGAAFRDALGGNPVDKPRERLSAGACALGALGRYSLATGVLGAILRWFVYGPLEAALRQALRPEEPAS